MSKKSYAKGKKCLKNASILIRILNSQAKSNSFSANHSQSRQNDATNKASVEMHRWNYKRNNNGCEAIWCKKMTFAFIIFNEDITFQLKQTVLSHTIIPMCNKQF